VGQGQNGHNIYALRPNCGSETFSGFGFKYHRKFKGWNLWEIATIGKTDKYDFLLIVITSLLCYSTT
jgi:hypothetical protein